MAGEGNNITNLSVGIGADTSAFQAAISQIEAMAAGLKDIKVKITPEVVGGTKKGAVDVPVNINTKEAKEKLREFRDKVQEIKNVAGNADVKFKIDTTGVDKFRSGVITYTNAIGQSVKETYKMVDVISKKGTKVGQSFKLTGRSFSDDTAKVKGFEESIRSAENQLTAFANKNTDIADRIGIDKLRQELDGVRQNANASSVDLKAFTNSLNEAKTQAAAIRSETAQQESATRMVAQAEREATAATMQRRQENENIQNVISKFAHSADTSLMTELRQQTAEYQKHVSILRQRIALERSSGSNKAATAQDRLQKTALKTTYHYARLVSYGKSFAQQMQKTYNSMSGIQGYARSTANIIKGILISQMFYAALSHLRRMVSEAANLNIELEATEAVLTGMFAGGQEQARELLEILKNEAIHTPFDVHNLTQATRMLTAYGVKAENLMYAMRAVEQATAASGDPQKMERISRAFGQIYTKGKLTAKEVRQLTEAGIAVGEILQKELGLTQAQLGEGWAKLNIDSTTALNALVKGINERYGTALDNMQVTTQQKLANAKEAFQLLGAEVTKPFLQAVGGALDKVVDKLDTFYKAVRAVGLGNALKTLIPPSVFNAVTTLINKVVLGVQVIKHTFNSLRPVIQAVLGGVEYYGSLIYRTFLAVSAVLSNFGQSVGSTAGGVASLTAFIIKLAGALFIVKAAMLAAAFAGKVWSTVTLVFKGVMAAANVMAGMIAALPAVFGLAAGAAAAPWMAVAGVLLGVAAIAAGLVGKFQEVKAAIGEVKDAFKNIAGGTNIKDMFTDLGTDLNKKIDEYNKKLEEDQGKFNQEFTGSGKAIEDSVDGAASKTKKAMEGLMSFDEVYKLTEAAAAGGAGRNDLLDDLDYDKIADFIGGAFKPDMFDFGEVFELDLKPLQDALKDLVDALDLKRMAIYAGKIAGYFLSMYIRSKMMTGENLEQYTYEKASTGEDYEQMRLEGQSTMQDAEQMRLEGQATIQDAEQLRLEGLSTIQDAEQLRLEGQSTLADAEQMRLEGQSTLADAEQLRLEGQSTLADAEQLRLEGQSTLADAEQLRLEGQATLQDSEQTRKVGTGGTASGGRSQQILGNLGLVAINAAQIAASAMSIVNSVNKIKEKKAKGEEVTWQDYMPLVSDILFTIIDIMQLVSAIAGLVAAIKMGKAAATGVSAISKGTQAMGGIGGNTMATGASGGIMAAIAPLLGPILIIAGIIALLLIIVKWGPQILEFLKGLLTAIGKLLLDVAAAVATIVLALGEAIANVITAFFSGIADVVTAFYEGVASLIPVIAEAAVKVISAIFEGIADVIKAIFEGIGDVIRSIADAISSVIDAIGDNIVKVINAIADGISQVINSIFDGLDRLASHLDPLIDAIARSIDTMSEALAAPLNGIGDILKSMSRVIDVIADNLPNWVGRLITAIGKISINVALPGSKITNHGGGGIFKKGTGLAVNAATLVGSNRFGEAGTEAVIPLERSPVVDMFAERIALSVAPLIPEAASRMSSQFSQAKQTAAMGGTLIPSASEIAGAIKSFLTPQLQAVVDALAQIEPIQVNNPMFLDNQGARKLTEKLESVRDSMGSRGRVGSKFVTV